MLGIDRRVVDPELQKIANTIVHNSKQARHLLEVGLCKSLKEEELHCYIDGNREDETPMPVGLHDMDTKEQNIKDQQVSQALAVRPDCNREALKLYTGVHGFFGRSLRRRAKRPSKLLQSECTFGMLVGTPPDNLLSFVGSTNTWYQLLESTKGKCLLEADVRRAYLSPEVDKFKDKTRLSTMDRAKSNPVKEAAVLAKRSPGWRQLPLDCMAHVIAGCYKDVFALTEELISGQINWALSLNYGSGLFSAHVWKPLWASQQQCGGAASASP